MEEEESEKLDQKLNDSNKKNNIEQDEPKGIDYDPYYDANCLSKLCFHWVFAMIKLAKQAQLKPSLLGRLSHDNDSSTYSAYLEYFWDTKDYKSIKHNALMKVIMRANICRLLRVLILSITSAALQFLNILLLKEFIDYFQTPEERRFTLLQLGITFISAQLIYVFTRNHTSLNLSFLGFRARYELNCFIFNKVLKVSPSSFEYKASHGEIINFLQVDSNRLSGLMYVSPDLVTAPLMIAAYIYLLFDFFGLSFLTGMGVILLFFGFNFLIFKYYRKIAQEMLKKSDHRMKLTTEIFDSIKVLKLYNWENDFMARILEARNQEVKVLMKRLLISTMNISLFWLCPVCVAIGTIGVYIYIEETFQISTMLIGLALFSRLQNPVRDLPWSINALVETFISMGRIEKFIKQHEYDETNVINEDPKEREYSIKISNGTFTWGKKAIKEEDKGKQKDEKKPASDGGKKEEKTKVNPQVNEKEDIIKESDKGVVIEEPGTNLSASVDDLKVKFVSNTNDSLLKPLLPEQNNSNIKDNDDKEGDMINEQPKIESDKEQKDYDIVLSDINLEIKQGETVGIIGEVGSGKTSLLQAILNSLILLSKPECDGIHIAGSIGYVSQIPWIQNDTIRNNILFFNEYDEEKYQKVLEVSQLKYDLNNLESNDLTEIGEKGINLSGGQKVRVSLARALYTNPDIFLFDDPISALDANIGRKVMDDCIIKYLNGKTRLIATHALYFLKDMDKIIYIDQGRIKWTGTYDEIIHEDFFKSLAKMEKERKKSQHKKSLELSNDEEPEVLISNGKHSDDEAITDEKDKEVKKEPLIKKLMMDEDQEIGVVKAQVYIKYCIYMGGVCFVLTIVLVMFLWAVNKNGSDFWLAYWSEPENQDPNKKVFFFSVYSGLGVASAFFIFFRILMLSLGAVKLSRDLHRDMITHLTKAPINLFHEIMPRGQLYNRLSKDLDQLQWMMYTVGNLLVSLFSVIGAIAICSIYDLYSLLFIPIFGVTGYALTAFYLNAKRALSRLERISSSPILNTISETIPGVISIKAFNKKQNYLQKFYTAVNDNFKVNVFFYGSETWFSLQFNLLSFLFVTYLVVYTIIFEEKSTPQSVGIMFTYSLILQESLQNLFVFCAYLETQMVSMERCLKYTEIQGENEAVMKEDQSLIEQKWPQKGKIEFRDYSVKYRPNTEVVLKNLSFEIESCEKIGVIGRTGSGKSTICLCLFRILEPLSGTIYIDDIDITSIGLDLLRQNITIIPQDPTLMQGTLKYNIDPFNTREDKEILSILKQIGFNIEDSQDSLLKEIEEKGNNLSVGEKQLVCIARAMLRKTKIIVMDEATANIDMKTEEKIQNALKLLMTNSTIITIAHRIKTIVNYDRILVLDNGNIAEFDSPTNLLKDKSSLFYELYSKSSI